MPFVFTLDLPDGKVEASLLKAGETSLGRKGSDICFEDKSVSRQHAKVIVQPLDNSASNPSARPKITVVDMSKFGTFTLREDGQFEKILSGESDFTRIQASGGRWG